MTIDDKRRQYETWVATWGADLFRFAYRLAGRRDQAEDLVQETFYHAWRSMDSLRDQERVRPWLFQILRHRYSHLVRSDTRRVRLGTPLEAVADPADDTNVAPLENMARQDALRTALGELDERYRMPFLMVFVEGRTCKEVAEELNLPLGTVLSRIYRGRQFLKQRLGDEAPAAEKKPKKEKRDEPPALRLKSE
jgi:RNA polymerase sigma-70 factor (ECF subfamily)